MSKKQTMRLSLITAAVLVVLLCLVGVFALNVSPIAARATNGDLIDENYSINITVDSSHINWAAEKDTVADPLFKYGYGLDYATKVDIELYFQDALCEDPAPTFSIEKYGEYDSWTPINTNPTDAGFYKVAVSWASAVRATFVFEIEPIEVAMNMAAGPFVYTGNSFDGIVTLGTGGEPSEYEDDFNVVMTWYDDGHTLMNAAPVNAGDYNFTVAFTLKEGSSKSLNNYVPEISSGSFHISQREVYITTYSELPYTGAADIKYDVALQGMEDPNFLATIAKPRFNETKTEDFDVGNTNDVSISMVADDRVNYILFNGDGYYEKNWQVTIVQANVPNSVLSFVGDFGPNFQYRESYYWAGGDDIFDRIGVATTSLPGHNAGGELALDSASWVIAKVNVISEYEDTEANPAWVALNTFDLPTMQIGETYTIRVDSLGNNCYKTNKIYFVFTVSKIRLYVVPSSAEVEYTGDMTAPTSWTYYRYTTAITVDSPVNFVNTTEEHVEVGEYYMSCEPNSEYANKDQYQFVLDDNAKYTIVAKTLTPSLTIANTTMTYGEIVDPSFAGVSSTDMGYHYEEMTMVPDTLPAQGITEKYYWRYSEELPADDEAWNLISWEEVTAGDYASAIHNVGYYQLKYDFICEGTEGGKINYKSAGPSIKTVTVSRATLTVKPTAGQSKTYGESDPTFTYTVSGSQYEDGVTMSDTYFSGKLARYYGENYVSGGYTYNVGTLALESPYSDNYTISFSTEDDAITFMINKKELTVTADNKTITYGDALPTYTATITGFIDEEDEDDITTGPSVTCEYTLYGHVGTYDINVEIGTLAASNYSFAFEKGTLTVNKKPIAVDFTLNDGTSNVVYYTPTYDGKTYTISASATGVNDEVITFATTESQKDVGSTYLTITAGDYKADGEETYANYTLAENATSQTLDIGIRNITVNVSGNTSVYGDAIATPSVTVISDQKEVQGETPWGTTAAFNALTSASTVAAGTGVTIFENKSDNYNITFSSGNTYTINPRNVTVTFENKTKVYDGTAFKPGTLNNVAAADKEDDEIIAANIAILYDTNITSATNAMDCIFGLTGASKANYKLVATDDYSVAYTVDEVGKGTVSLDISRRPITVTVTGATHVYGQAKATTENGMTIAVTSDLKVVGGEADPWEYTAAYAGITTTTDVGTAISVLQQKNNAVNYIVSFEGNDYVITAKPVTISAIADEMIYSGEEKGITASYTPVGEEEMAVSVTYDNVDRTNYTGTAFYAYVAITDGNYTIAENGAYAIADGKAKFGPYTIAKKEVTATVATLSAPALVYNGEAKTIAAPTFNKVSGKGTTVNVTYNGDNANVTQEGFTVSFNLSNEDAVNYALIADTGYTVKDGVATTTTPWIITQKALTIKAKDVTVTYGDGIANNQFGYTVTGLIEGDELTGTPVYNTYYYDGDAYDYEDSYNPYYAGVSSSEDYTVHVSGLSAGNNYDVTFSTGVVYIVKREVTVTWAESYSYAYGGSFGENVVPTIGNRSEYDDEDDVYAVVSVQENENYPNVGTYTAVITGLAGDDPSNYKLPESGIEKAFTITARVVTFDWSRTNDNEAAEGFAPVYNGKENVVTATINNVVTGDTVAVKTMTGNVGTNKGDYTATVTELDNNDLGNYTLDGAETKAWSIAKATAVITGVAGAENLVYNGAEQALLTNGGSTTFGEIVYSLDNKTYDAIATIKGTDANTYTVYYKVVGTDNYDGADGTVEVAIGARPVAVTLSETGNVYNNPHRFYYNGLHKAGNNITATYTTVNQTIENAALEVIGTQGENSDLHFTNNPFNYKITIADPNYTVAAGDGYTYKTVSGKTGYITTIDYRIEKKKITNTQIEWRYDDGDEVVGDDDTNAPVYDGKTHSVRIVVKATAFTEDERACYAAWYNALDDKDGVPATLEASFGAVLNNSITDGRSSSDAGTHTATLTKPSSNILIGGFYDYEYYGSNTETKTWYIKKAPVTIGYSYTPYSSVTYVAATYNYKDTLDAAANNLITNKYYLTGAVDGDNVLDLVNVVLKNEKGDAITVSAESFNALPAGTYTYYVTAEENANYSIQNEVVDGALVLANNDLAKLVIGKQIVTVDKTQKSIVGVNKVYDGTSAATLDCSNAAILGNVKTGDEIGVIAEGVFWNTNAGKETAQAGATTIKITKLTLIGKDAGNYEILEDTVQVQNNQRYADAEITKAEVTVTLRDQTTTYGDTNYREYTAFSYVSSNGDVLAEEIAANKVSLIDIFTVNGGVSQGQGYGDYAPSVHASNPANYAVAAFMYQPEEGDAVAFVDQAIQHVAKRPITIVYKEDAAKEKTYNGKTFAEDWYGYTDVWAYADGSKEILSADGNLGCLATIVKETADGDAYTGVLGAGTYFYDAVLGNALNEEELSANYELTVTPSDVAKLIVNGKSIVPYITLDNVPANGNYASVVYDGKEHTFKVVAAGIDETVEIFSATATNTFEGGYECGANTIVEDNYVIENAAEFTWAITARPITVTYEGSAKEMTYGDTATAWEELLGDMLENAAYLATEDAVANEEEEGIVSIVCLYFNTMANGTGTDYDFEDLYSAPAGIYYMIVEGDNTNYNVTADLGDKAYLQIRQAELTLGLSVSGKTYDGTAIVAPTFGHGIAVSGWKHNDTAELIGENNVMVMYAPVGDTESYEDVDDNDWSITAPITAGDYYVAAAVGGLDNYDTAYEVKVVTIEKASLSVNYTYEGNFEYGAFTALSEGNGFTISGWKGGDTNALLTAETFTVTYCAKTKSDFYEQNQDTETEWSTTALTDAGIYYVRVYFKGLENYRNAAWGREYIITKKAITLGLYVDGVAVNGNDATKVYDGQAHTFVVKALGAGSEIITLAEETITNAENVEVSFTAGNYAADDKDVENYVLAADAAFTYSITKKPIEEVIFKLDGAVKNSVEYDGNNHGVVAYATGVDGELFGIGGGAGKEAGSYTVTVAADAYNDNYVLDEAVTFTWSIVEKAAVVDPDTGVATYEKDIPLADATSESGSDVTALFKKAAADTAEAKEIKVKVGEDTTIVFDAAAISQLSAATNVSMKVNVVSDVAAISAAAKEALRSAEMIIEVSLGGINFEAGKATVSVPFDKAVPDGMVGKVYYVDENGNKTDMNAKFEDGKVTFETNHFSDYIVVFEKAGGLGAGAIAGIVIGCVVGVAGIAVLIFFLLKKKKGGKAGPSETVASEAAAE